MRVANLASFHALLFLQVLVPFTCDDLDGLPFPRRDGVFLFRAARRRAVFALLMILLRRDRGVARGSIALRNFRNVRSQGDVGAARRGDEISTVIEVVGDGVAEVGQVHADLVCAARQGHASEHSVHDGGRALRVFFLVLLAARMEHRVAKNGDFRGGLFAVISNPHDPAANVQAGDGRGAKVHRPHRQIWVEQNVNSNVK